MPDISDACQSGKAVTLLNSLFFVFRILFLCNYRVKYYDYIVKWCSGIAYNWCVSLDIGLVSPLRCSFSLLGVVCS